MPEWFYDTGGSEVGPITSSELIAKIRAFEVKVDTPVRKDDSQWVPAIEINGLFETAAKPIDILVCPYCGHAVDEPPCDCSLCGRFLLRVKNKRTTSPVTADGERNREKKIGWMRRLFSD